MALADSSSDRFRRCDSAINIGISHMKTKIMDGIRPESRLVNDDAGIIGSTTRNDL